MIRIHTISIGQPQTLSDERGTWRSAIFRTPVDGPIMLGERGLVGDQVADTEHHGSPDQAICCHPIDHYDYWNQHYGLQTPATRLGPGSVGENWTLSGANEQTICVGDVIEVGSAVVQVSGPRYPCAKQERKVGLAGFLRQTIETMRTGFYLRVLTPGIIQSGDAWEVRERPQPAISIDLINTCVHRPFNPQLAARLQAVPELADGWKRIIDIFRDKHGA